jgi:integrase
MSKLVKLTARTVEAAEPGTEVRDTAVPGLRLRISPKGHRRFILVTHFPGQKHASRRGLMATDLKEAREEALEWKRLVRRGVDPHEDEERKKREALRRRKDTFLAVAEAYIADLHRRKCRSAAFADREIRRELISKWSERPISEIDRSDVVTLVEAIRDRPSPYSAHTAFSFVRSLFGWAIHRGEYGLETSPCDRLKPAKLIGEKKPRQRVLTDDEIRVFWRATNKLGYPNGTMLRMLLLTGQRRAEVARAHWGEFDFDAKVWTVPPERFKSDSTHLVPLTADVLALLCGLPRFKSGDFVFATGRGAVPVNNFSRVKYLLDEMMLEELRQADPNAKLTPFVLHDLRRTMRTRLSSLRVPDTVAEMVIGHGRKGLQRVYDQHKFIDEMREALEAWNALLRAIVNPPPANVVPLAERGVS